MLPGVSSPLLTIALRCELRPGDLGAVVSLHGTLYAREHGFDPTFEAYVAGPLAAFALKGSPRERLWLAERGMDGPLLGCVAIVEAEDDPRTAQLRWYLVAPQARGAGLGRRLARNPRRPARQGCGDDHGARRRTL